MKVGVHNSVKFFLSPNGPQRFWRETPEGPSEHLQFIQSRLSEGGSASPPAASECKFDLECEAARSIRLFMLEFVVVIFMLPVEGLYDFLWSDQSLQHIWYS